MIYLYSAGERQYFSNHWGHQGKDRACFSVFLCADSSRENTLIISGWKEDMDFGEYAKHCAQFTLSWRLMLLVEQTT